MQSLILECAVRASLIAICVGAVLCVLRVKAARVRHAVWASVAALMLALPGWMAWGPKATFLAPLPAAAPTISQAVISTAALSARALPTPPVHMPAWTWQNFLGGVYLLGVFTLLTRLAIGTVRAHLLVRRAAKRDGRLTSDSCAAPVTVGWLTPTVILPASWRQWPQAQLNAVLTHEGEHARWRDPLALWLALLNRAVFWFHPLAWWLERRISALSEEACDAAVLARGHDRFEYSEYLLQIARAMQQTGARVKAIGMAMPGAFLPQRIRRIVEGRPAQRISRVRVACVAVACAAVSTVFTAGAMDRAQAQAAAPIPQIVAEPTPAPAVRVPAPHRRPKVLLAQAHTGSAKPNPAAQETGSISGTVQDPSGARVPNCLVVLHDQSGAEVATVISDATGRYRFSSVPAGHYTVEFQVQGFAKLKKEAAIEAGQPMRIDAQLEIGQVSQVLTVIGQKLEASAPAAPEPGIVSVGGRVEMARQIARTEPIYPPELQQQGVEGTVRIAAIISRDGVPLELHVLNSGQVDSRFIRAALNAVKEWRYQPTKLNGNPVAFSTNIEVNFELAK